MPGAPVITGVEIRRNDVFSAEDRGLFYRAINSLHRVTEERVIKRELLLREGDLFDRDRAAETERILRALPFIADARVKGEPNPDGSVRLIVETWDQFSLRFGLSGGLFGGDSSARASLGESNLLGTGKAFNVKWKQSSDDSTSAITYNDPQFLTTHHDFKVGAEDSEEGGSYDVFLSQPFRTLDSQYSYGFRLTRDRRDVDFFEEGDEVAEVPSLQDSYSVFLQGAEGPREFRRFVGLRLSYSESEFGEASGEDAADVDIPPDDQITEVGPTFGAEYIRRFIQRRYVDQMDVPEDVSVGVKLDGFVGLHHREISDDSNQNQFATHLSLTSSYDPDDRQLFTFELFLQQRFLAGEVRGFSQSVALHYYNQWIDQHTLAGSVAFDRMGDEDGLEPQLTLGEDNGLRGYPARYFTGDHRLRINLEDRILTPWEVLKVKIGLAVFFDMGYAWDEADDVSMGDLYRSVGIGLRLGNSSLFNKVARIDFAFPLDDAPEEEFSFSVSASAGQIFGLFGNAEGLDSEF